VSLVIFFSYCTHCMATGLALLCRGFFSALLERHSM
jgi:hypothetical protein